MGKINIETGSIAYALQEKVQGNARNARNAVISVIKSIIFQY